MEAVAGDEKLGLEGKERVEESFFTPKDLLTWFDKHYGRIVTGISLLGSFFAIWQIWRYLGEFGARDLFIPALSDPSVSVLVLFSAVIFLLMWSLLIGYGVLLLFIVVAWIWNKIKEPCWKWLFNSVVLFGFGYLILVAIFYSLPTIFTDFLAVVFYYLIIVGSIVFSINLLISNSKLWRLSVVFCLVEIVIALGVFSGQVSNEVTHLAGISQLPSQTRSYLIDKKYAPAFKANKDVWMLATEGDMLAVCGYKIFQLSDITVLCPRMKEEGASDHCTRMKSSEVLAMPNSYVASGVVDNTQQANESCVHQIKANP